MTDEQSRALWEGRNHPEIRKWMENPEPFSYESHKSFVVSLKNREDRIYWAVIHDNQVIGSYCLNPYDKRNSEGEMGKYLLFNYIGVGLGKLVTAEFLNYIFSNNIVTKIVAKTLLQNKINQHINMLMGFNVTGRDEKYIYMELDNYFSK
jgi:RimJ/RimL family protein N-acetyltransferase